MAVGATGRDIRVKFDCSRANLSWVIRLAHFVSKDLRVSDYAAQDTMRERYRDLRE